MLIDTICNVQPSYHILFLHKTITETFLEKTKRTGETWFAALDSGGRIGSR